MDLEMEMDLQCKGEHLNLECDEDLGRAASLTNSLDWLCMPPSTAHKRLDFIPVRNDCPLSDSEPSYKYTPPPPLLHLLYIGQKEAKVLPLAQIAVAPHLQMPPQRFTPFHVATMHQTCTTTSSRI